MRIAFQAVLLSRAAFVHVIVPTPTPVEACENQDVDPRIWSTDPKDSDISVPTDSIDPYLTALRTSVCIP